MIIRMLTKQGKNYLKYVFLILIIIVAVVGAAKLHYHYLFLKQQSQISLMDCEVKLEDCKSEIEAAQKDLGVGKDWANRPSGSGLTWCRSELKECNYELETIQKGLSPIKWVERFGGPGRDIASSIQQTTDGGYIVVGATDYGLLEVGNVVSSFDFDDVYLLKIDADGNKSWEKTYKYGGYSQNGFEGGFSVQQTSDGGYIIAGWTIENCIECYLDALLIKTDAQGNKVWEKIFGGEKNDVAYSVQQTSDGGYIIAGWTDSFGAESRDVYLFKTDANGNKQWEKTFGGRESDTVSSVQQTSDGGYILAGTTASFESDTSYGEEGRQDIYVIKTDADGEKIWERNFGADRQGLDVGSSAQQTLDGGYIVAGATFSRERMSSHEQVCEQCAYLLKLDSSGNRVWDKILGKNFGTSNALSIQQTSDGKYIIAGLAGLSFEGKDAKEGIFYLLRTDTEGNTLWEKLLGSSHGPSGSANSVRQASDGGYIMAGNIGYLRETSEESTIYWNAAPDGTEKHVYNPEGRLVRNIAFEDDLYIIKTDELGNTEETGDFGGNIAKSPIIESEIVIAETKESKIVMLVMIYNLGDEIGIGGKYVIVHSIADYVEPSKPMQPKLGNKYVIVDLSAINYGPPVSVNISDFTLEDDSSNSYTAVTTSKKPVFFTGTLSQYRINRGYISYEVPKNVSGLKLLIYNPGGATAKINLGK